jgi:hypothetical protein
MEATTGWSAGFANVTVTVGLPPESTLTSAVESSGSSP